MAATPPLVNTIPVKPVSTARFIWNMRPYLRQVAGQLVLGSLGGIVMNTAVVLPSILLGRAIEVALALSRGTATSSDLTWAALAFVGGTLLTEGPRVVKRWWLMTANARIRANVRADAFRGVLSRPMADLHQTSIGDVMGRVVGDVEVLDRGMRELTVETWDTILFSISLVVAMAVIDPSLTAAAFVPVLMALLISLFSGRWVSTRTTRAREANADLTASIQELLGGFRVIRLFGRGRAATDEVENLSRRFAGRNLAVVRLRTGLQPLYAVLMTAGMVFVVWLGGGQVVDGAMGLGTFVAYLGLFLRFTNRGQRIPQMINSLHSGAAAYARLRPLLAPPLSVHGEPPWASFRLGHVAGIATQEHMGEARALGPVSVSLQNVTFRYPGASAPALKGISLEVPPGALVAVTGPVGSGKSALARALLGVYSLEDGDIRLDGRPVQETPTSQRERLIGYLPQEANVFSGSILDNVALTVSGTQSDSVQRALRLAALEEDISRFPSGLDTQIGELGVQISGGQRGRVGLARALAAAPGLLVLDEPFSAVDAETEIRIVAALRETFGPQAPFPEQATIVLCSHRLAAFPLADLVVVLEEGRVKEMGAHAELLAQNGLYDRIFRAQERARSSEVQVDL